MWDAVQSLLKTGPPHDKACPPSMRPRRPLLRGLIFPAAGRTFTPGWTARGRNYYRDHINADAINLGKEACDVRRMPAGEIEAVRDELLPAGRPRIAQPR